MIAETYFSRMLQCGADANSLLEHVLIYYFPRQLLDEWKDRLVFLSGARADAFRVGKKLREEREIIVISERIIPKGGGVAEDDPGRRYFVFAALHELAHVVRQHKPPNEITADENRAQEAEADELAFGWFNAYIRRRKHPDLGEFTRKELNAAIAKSQAGANA
jgi:hypothetical protein